MKPNTLSLVLFLLLTHFALTLGVDAVVPPPDGGYPGFNTAEGQNALKNLSTGVGNAAVGWYSLFSDTDGSYNTAVGAGTLVLNVGDQNAGTGIENTATGAVALLSNNTGTGNTADGAFALRSNTTGFYNTATGQSALLNNNGTDNTGIGSAALIANTSGNENTATGAGAMYTNTSGALNTATGEWALFDNVAGNNNTATGAFALVSSTGNNNTALGYSAGSNLTTGDNNVDIGYNVLGVAGESNTIRIGNADITSTIIRGISGQTISSGATVLVASNGQLGTMTSSGRFKRDIKPLGDASAALFALKPVTFRYKKEIDPAGTAQFGLVAEEVAKVNTDLVVRDEEGKAYSVRYDQVNAMLLNEFLKEHRTVQEQEATIAELRQNFAQQQKQIEALTAGLQKVNAQLELNKPAPQTVLNNQ